jgi:polyisoprenoid-binding protein YceI
MKKLIIDQAHSDIEFKVKHLMISTVKGNFQTFFVSLNN